MLFALSTSTLLFVHDLSHILPVNAYIYRRGSIIARPKWAMFIVTLISFLIASLYWTSVTAVMAILIRSSLVENVDIPLGTRLGLSNLEAYKPETVATWTSEFLVYLISRFYLSGYSDESFFSSL